MVQVTVLGGPPLWPLAGLLSSGCSWGASVRDPTSQSSSSVVRHLLSLLPRAPRCPRPVSPASNSCHTEMLVKTAGVPEGVTKNYWG